MNKEREEFKYEKNPMEMLESNPSNFYRNPQLKFSGYKYSLLENDDS